MPGSGQDVQSHEWVAPVVGSPDGGPASPSQVLIHRDRVCGVVDNIQDQAEARVHREGLSLG